MQLYTVLRFTSKLAYGSGMGLVWFQYGSNVCRVKEGWPELARQLGPPYTKKATKNANPYTTT